MKRYVHGLEQPRGQSPAATSAPVVLASNQPALPLPADAATQTTLAAVLAKLSSDPATEATLAAIRQAFNGQIPKTAFDEVRVAQPHPVAGWTFNYTFNGRHVVQTQTGGAPAITVSLGRAVVSVSGPSQSNTLETRAALRYLPGVGGLLRMTAPFAAPAADLFQEAGIGDASDGLFLYFNELTFGVLLRSSSTGAVVPTFVPQTDWNVDPFDGTGPSGATFDPLLGHPFSFSYQWLGYGALALSIEDPVTGRFFLAHVFMFAGTSLTTSIRNPTLPCHVRLVTGPAYAAGLRTLHTPSAMAFADGDPGVPVGDVLAADWQVGNAKATPAGATTERPIVAVRNGATFGGITSRIRAELTSLSLCASISAGTPRTVIVRAYVSSNAAADTALGGAPAFGAVHADSCCTFNTAAPTFTPSAALLERLQWRVTVPYAGSPTIDLPKPIYLLPGETLMFTYQLSTFTGGASVADVEVTPRWIEPI